MRTNGFRQSWPQWAAYAVLSVIAAVAVLVAQQVMPFWFQPVHDELHYYLTIQRFQASFSLETLRSYGEASPPLPFILYALWGSVAGMEIETLRWFSVVIAAATYYTFFGTMMDLRVPPRVAALLLLVLGANPYMLALNVLVYTDMLLFLFQLLALRALLQSRAAPFFLFNACALLTRQYHAAFWIAAVVFLVLMLGRGGGRDARRLLLAALASVLPLLALFWLWGGVAPASPLTDRLTDLAFSFHGSYVHLYGALVFYYLMPIYPFTFQILRRTGYFTPLVFVGIAVLGAGYWLAPVGPNEIYAEQGIERVGRLHWLLIQVGIGTTAQQAVFFIGYLFALPLLYFIGRDGYERLRQHRYDHLLALDLVVLSFFCVMPFSYLAWEKYFLPVMIVLLLRWGCLWGTPLTEKSSIAGNRGAL